MIRASWQGGAFALVAWLVCRLWRKMPASVACVVWLLVCIKLLIGLSPLAVSLPWLPAEKMVVTSLPTSPRLIEVFPEEAVVSQAAPVNQWFVAWVAGVAGLVLFVLLALFRLRKLLQGAQPLVAPAFQELAQEMGLRRAPRLLVTDREVEVLTVGAFRPCVLVSRSMLERCSAEEMRLIFAHELAHLKRRDAWLALVPQTTTILFFFHPAAWLAAREFELAREAACDEIAVQNLKVPSDVYGRLLLKIGARREFAGSYFVMGISSHFRALSRRIAMLNRLSSDSQSRRALVVVGLAGLMFVMPWTLVHAQGTVSDPVSRPSTPPPSSDPVSKPATKPQEPKINYAKYLKVDFYQFKYVKVKDALVAAGKDKSLEIAPDVRSNSTFVKGPKGKVDAYILKLKALDQKKPQISSPRVGESVFVSPGKGGDATELARRIIQDLRGHYDPRDFRVLVDIGTNLVVVELSPRISKEAVARVKAIKPGKPLHEPQLKTFPIKYQSAAEMARVLLNMAGPNTGSSVIADEQTNAVVIKATPEMMAKFAGWISALDRKTQSDPVTKPEKSLRRFPIKNVDAKVAMERVKEQLEKLGADFVSYDPTDNSLIVRFVATKIEEVHQVVAEADHP